MLSQAAADALDLLTRSPVAITTLDRTFAAQDAAGVPLAAMRRPFARAIAVPSLTSLCVRPRPLVSFTMDLPSTMYDALVACGDFNVHLLSPTYDGLRIARLLHRGDRAPVGEDGQEHGEGQGEGQGSEEAGQGGSENRGREKNEGDEPSMTEKKENNMPLDDLSDLGVLQGLINPQRIQNQLVIGRHNWWDQFQQAKKEAAQDLPFPPDRIIPKTRARRKQTHHVPHISGPGVTAVLYCRVSRTIQVDPDPSPESPHSHVSICADRDGGGRDAQQQQYEHSESGAPESGTPNKVVIVIGEVVDVWERNSVGRPGLFRPSSLPYAIGTHLNSTVRTVRPFNEDDRRRILRRTPRSRHD
ncbi:hypothetical protein F4808DRAFT_433042 [Astrocystis sublimbata]|nr:hypothetical protein F4808DRAFT_433042 [Astrocystis sublimbata]